MNIYERELLMHKFHCKCVIYITMHRGSITVLGHFEHRNFVPVRHHLTTVTAPFMHEKGHHFSTMKAPFMREDRGMITPLSTQRTFARDCNFVVDV